MMPSRPCETSGKATLAPPRGGSASRVGAAQMPTSRVAWGGVGSSAWGIRRPAGQIWSVTDVKEGKGRVGFYLFIY